MRLSRWSKDGRFRLAGHRHRHLWGCFELSDNGTQREWKGGEKGDDKRTKKKDDEDEGRLNGHRPKTQNKSVIKNLAFVWTWTLGGRRRARARREWPYEEERVRTNRGWVQLSILIAHFRTSRIERIGRKWSYERSSFVDRRNGADCF